MASGEEAKKEFSILDTGVQVDLPDHFCLERPENDKVNFIVLLQLMGGQKFP